MSDDLEPLPPLGGLAMRALAAEKARPDVDAAMHDRVLARVVASVAVGAVGAVVTGAAATAHAAGTTGAATTGVATTGAATTGVAGGAATGTGAATVAGLTVKTLPWILAAFVAGGGVGAAVHAAVTSAPATAPATSVAAAPTTGAMSAMSATSASTAPSGASADLSQPAVPVGALPPAPVAASSAHGAAPAAAPAPAAPPASVGKPTADGSGNDVDLAAERSLVDRARTALGRGQSSDALAALDAHAARYPHGRLVEEREALAVEALARSGRMDLAGARAARFRATYPKSVFTGVVDAALVPR